jgi:hypothetical protein
MAAPSRTDVAENLLAAVAVFWALHSVSLELAVGVAGAGVLAFNLYRTSRRGV